MKTRHTFTATLLVALLAIAGVTAAIAADPADPPPPRIAFVANGRVPADALAAGPIAGQLGAPVYTTEQHALPDSTADALDDYNPELVIVMGGSVAISDDVVNAIAAATGLPAVDPTPPPTTGVVRAAGADRFVTATIVADLLGAYDPAYLGVDLQAVDADLLDGKDSSAFQPAGNYALADQACATGQAVTGIAANGTSTCASFAQPIGSGEVNPAEGNVYLTGGLTYEGNPSTGLYCFSLDPALGLTAEDVYGVATNDWSYGGFLNSGAVHFRSFPGGCGPDEFAFFTDVFATDGDGDVVGTAPSGQVVFGFLVFAEPSTSVTTSATIAPRDGASGATDTGDSR